MSDQLTEEKLELLNIAGYSKKAIDLYLEKVNVGVIENANVELPYTGPCGDTCKIYLKINDQNVIENAKFQYLGCPASAACGSIVTQIAKGKTLREAEKITEKEVIEKLGGLPGNECHCATLVLTTLCNAIKKYENNKKR
ncbi:MAG: iron-sulfur cluster assembly scaffold protein [Candidatus Bathyarchaeia archaeon]